MVRREQTYGEEYVTININDACNKDTRRKKKKKTLPYMCGIHGISNVQGERR